MSDEHLIDVTGKAEFTFNIAPLQKPAQNDSPKSLAENKGEASPKFVSKMTIDAWQLPEDSEAAQVQPSGEPIAKLQVGDSQAAIINSDQNPDKNEFVLSNGGDEFSDCDEYTGLMEAVAANAPNDNFQGPLLGDVNLDAGLVGPRVTIAP